MCYIDGQKNKYSVLNECSRMLKYNIFNGSLQPNLLASSSSERGGETILEIRTSAKKRNLPGSSPGQVT
jgi:hypothetical protein